MESAKEFQMRVNPIYTTGKGTTACLAKAGNMNAAAIIGKMDVSELASSKQEVPEIIRKCYAVALESRYEISNEMIRRADKPYVVDLPSGYTPRAFSTAEEGRTYIGIDLPIVADEIGPIVSSLIPAELSDRSAYYGADATNYESLRRSLDKVDGEVCIITDGLLGYFNEPELTAMCNNVKRILREFGGCWVTGDVTNEIIFGLTFATLLKDVPEMLASFSMNTASKMADVDMKKNSLYDGGPEKALRFLKDIGFTVEKISYADLMPAIISLKDEPDKIEAIKEAYRPIEMWKMTLAEDSGNTITEEVKTGSFNADLSMDAGDLRIALGGRLDTITAPELLEKFESITKGQELKSVVIDAENVQYISSAGLRVLLIIYKAVGDKESFKMINVSKEIEDIFTVTGFSDFFLG